MKTDKTSTVKGTSRAVTEGPTSTTGKGSHPTNQMNHTSASRRVPAYPIHSSTTKDHLFSSEKKTDPNTLDFSPALTSEEKSNPMNPIADRPCIHKHSGEKDGPLDLIKNASGWRRCQFRLFVVSEAIKLLDGLHSLPSTLEEDGSQSSNCVGGSCIELTTTATNNLIRFPNLSKTFPNLSKHFQNIFITFPNLSKTFPNISKHFQNLSKTFPNLSKPKRSFVVVEIHEKSDLRDAKSSTDVRHENINTNTKDTDAADVASKIVPEAAAADDTRGFAEEAKKVRYIFFDSFYRTSFVFSIARKSQLIFYFFYFFLFFLTCSLLNLIYIS